MWLFLWATFAFGQAKDPVNVMPYQSECAADLDQDGTTERALLIQTKSAPTRRLSLMILDTKSLSVVWSQDTAAAGTITCTETLSLSLDSEVGLWKWDGKTYRFHEAAQPEPELVACPKHATCAENSLDECLCDAKGALHSFELPICFGEFNPPCPAGKLCNYAQAMAACMSEED